MISHYSFGSITIDGKKYEHDVIVSSSGVKSWWRATSHNVSMNDLDPILSEKPKLVIFGTGAAGVMEVAGESEDHLEEQQIKVVIKKTADAIKEYNLRQSEPGVVGAFHLTC
ncbi:MAG: MTH938/NDUFAF3 family protein [Candidatus Margulisiibacteriota bacterium]